MTASRGTSSHEVVGIGRWGVGLAALAGLGGAAGVALAATAAHKVNNPSLLAAATMLQVHAAAALALLALSQWGRVPTAWMVAASLVLAGSALFAKAIALPMLFGISLFPMAAPIGGSMVIAGWLAVAAAAVLEARSNREG